MRAMTSSCEGWTVEHPAEKTACRVSEPRGERASTPRGIQSQLPGGVNGKRGGRGGRREAPREEDQGQEERDKKNDLARQEKDDGEQGEKDKGGRTKGFVDREARKEEVGGGEESFGDDDLLEREAVVQGQGAVKNQREEESEDRSEGLAIDLVLQEGAASEEEGERGKEEEEEADAKGEGDRDRLVSEGLGEKDGKEEEKVGGECGSKKDVAFALAPREIEFVLEPSVELGVFLFGAKGVFEGGKAFLEVGGRRAEIGKERKGEGKAFLGDREVAHEKEGMLETARGFGIVRPRAEGLFKAKAALQEGLVDQGRLRGGGVEEGGEIAEAFGRGVGDGERVAVLEEVEKSRAEGGDRREALGRFWLEGF